MATLKRDPVRVKRNLREGADGGLFTDVPLKIQIPSRYLERNMGSTGAETFILGTFVYIMEESYYGLSMVNSMVRITPRSTELVDVNESQYLQFSFDAGDRVFYSLDLPMSSTLTYYIYDEFISKGRIPWYFNYIDLSRIFDTALEYAGVNLGNHAILNLMAMTIARDRKDLMQLFRTQVLTQDDINRNDFVLTPFRSVVYNTPNTVSKIIGSHFGDSLTSAIVNQTETVERIEEFLRE